MNRTWLICWVLAAILVLALLAVWQGRAYVAYSDGVYADSAQLVLDGRQPYRDFAAAQPPGIYYAGAGILELGDSVLALRRGLALVDLLLALVVLLITLQLTGSRISAAVAGTLALLTPWALREHAQLLPETFGALLLAGAMLAAGRRRSSALAGLAGAVAAIFKVAFLVPAFAIAVAAAAPLPALATLTVGAVGGYAVSAAAFGAAFWHGAFEAQGQTGLTSLHYVGGLWAQAAWNLLPLLVPAGIALHQRRRAVDPQTLRVVIAGAAGSLVLVLGLAKQGSYLNALVAVEPPLLILAVCGCSWLLTSRGPQRFRAIAALAALLGAVQLGSLLISPRDPGAFGRPFAAAAPGWTLTDSQVRKQLRRIDRCPAQLAYSGSPYLALLARRRMPGEQPDQFIITHAQADRAFKATAERDRPRCP